MWRSLSLTEVAICWGTSAQQCPELTFFSHLCPCALTSYFCSPPLAFPDQELRDQNVWLVLKIALKFHPNSNAGTQVSWVELFLTICFPEFYSKNEPDDCCSLDISSKIRSQIIPLQGDNWKNLLISLSCCIAGEGQKTEELWQNNSPVF